MTRRRVDRWGVGLVGALALVGVGLLFATPTLIVAAAIPLAYVLYGSLSRVPPAELSISRAFGTPDPAPGETVDVTLTVENAGESVLTDCRLIDGVPEELAVTAGSPRACLSLPPGESATVSYTVVATRGEYRFRDPVVRLRSLSGTERLTETIAPDGDATLSCTNAVRDAPVSDATLPRAGTFPTDSGGSGLEFFATRPYQHGDPMTRVDWRHYAKTGEFVTVQYRQEQAIRTVLVVDARPVGRVTPRPGYPTGAALSAYAGQQLFAALSGAGVATTVAAVGVEEDTLDGFVGPDGLAWLDPSASGSRASHARTLFRDLQTVVDRNARAVTLADLLARTGARAGEADRHAPPPDDGVSGEALATDGGPDETTRRLLARLPPNAQVVVCTPLLDDWPATLARALDVRGYPLVVLSPDVTGGDTVGQRILDTTRQFALRELDHAGARTVSWDVDQPVDHALKRSLPHLLRS